MPSRRHSSAMLSSPRKPSSTMRIFSSAPYCLRVLRLMSLMICSDDDDRHVGFCLISTPQVRMNKNTPLNQNYICSIGDDGTQSCLHYDLSEILEQTRPPDPDLVDLIEQAFLEGQIDSKTAELAYLWSMGKILTQKHAQTSIGLFTSHLLN